MGPLSTLSHPPCPHFATHHVHTLPPTMSEGLTAAEEGAAHASDEEGGEVHPPAADRARAADGETGGPEADMYCENSCLRRVGAWGTYVGGICTAQTHGGACMWRNRMNTQTRP